MSAVADAGGWTRVETADGSVYFQNKAAKLTSWERPGDVPANVEIPLYHRKYKGKVQNAVEEIDGTAGSPATAAAGGGVAPKKTPWVKVLAEESGEYYYMNRKTKTTTWERPDTGGIPIPMWAATFPSAVPVALPASPNVQLRLAVGRSTAPAGDRRPECQSAASEPLWQEVREQGDTFYRNTKTGETAWDRPADLDGDAGAATAGTTPAPQPHGRHGARALEFGVVLDGVGGDEDGTLVPLAEALVRVGLQTPAAARERAAFAADGSEEDVVFRRLAALRELLQFEAYAPQWASVDDASASALAKAVIGSLQGDHVSDDVRSMTAQVLGALHRRMPVFAGDGGRALAKLLEAELGCERVWAHCVVGLLEATVLRRGTGTTSPRRASSSGATGVAGGDDDGGGGSDDDDALEHHDPSMLAFLGIVQFMAVDFRPQPTQPRQAPPPQLTEVIVKSLGNCTDEVFPEACMRLVDISHMVAAKEYDDHVVKALTEFPQARHLSEGLVHVLNEYRFPCKDEAFLKKILRLFVAIVSSPATADFFYSNDLKVLIDIIVRESEDMPAASSLQYPYLQLVDVILRFSPWRTKGGRYRAGDVASMLNVTATAAEVPEAKALATKILNEVDLEE